MNTAMSLQNITIHQDRARATLGSRLQIRSVSARRMDMLDRPSWGWGLSLIVLTVAIHAMAIVIMAFFAMKIRLRQKARSLSSWNLLVITVCVIGAIGLLLAVLHGLECAIWAAAYLWLGALNSPLNALLFSVDSMTTRGASGLTLPPHWQMMGALEAVDGMLLFGVSTAYMFAVMQGYWAMLAQHLSARSSHANR